MTAHRAQWLALAANELIPLTHRSRWPHEVRIGVGPMRVVPASNVGEAWIEGHTGFVTVRDDLSNSIEVLEVLLHELIHLSVGPRHGHGYRFRRACHKAGLAGNVQTTAVAGPRLLAQLFWITEALGPYPAESAAA